MKAFSARPHVRLQEHALVTFETKNMREKHSFTRSFVVAVAGIIVFFRTERSAKIQLAVSVVVILAAIALRITLIEWFFVLGAIVIVWVTEMLNTAIEKVCNLITVDYDPTIKVVKDMCAGAVLIASIGAVIIGFIIFLPRVLEWF